MRLSHARAVHEASPRRHRPVIAPAVVPAVGPAVVHGVAPVPNA
eukprot:gene6528-4585_t